jgi:CoA:oxalate CoA-transferase
VHFGGVRRGDLRSAPALGEHTDEILSSLAGLTADEIASLRASGGI